MKSFILVAIFGLATRAISADSLSHVRGGIALPIPPLVDDDIFQLESAAPDVKSATFDQLIDHSRPELGTFKQRWYYTTEFYRGPGSPIVLEAPSESALDRGYVSNATITGFLAQNIGGAGIQLEHRFFGKSTPAALNTETGQQYTLENSLQDLIYFAKNVKLPFDKNGKSKPHLAPWVLTGCSYPGALTAWTQALNPGTFWAYHATSAVVETVGDFGDYYTPIERAMPRNCSADYRKIIANMDKVLLYGTEAEKRTLKVDMGFDETTADFNVAASMNYNLYGWQSHQFSRGPADLYERVCNYIEGQYPGSNEPIPGPEGIGLKKALKGVKKLMQGESYGALGESSLQDAGPEPWYWLLCNEPFEWWQIWSNATTNGLISQFIDREYILSAVCDRNFPDVGKYQYGIKKGRFADQINRVTGGWNNVNTTRLIWVNGEFDPWLPATVSWDGRPGGALQSTKQHPVYLLPKATHCNDYLIANGNANEGVRIALAGIKKQMKEWVDEFYKSHKIAQP